MIIKTIIKRFLCLSACLSLFPLFSSVSFASYQTTKHVLDNGLTVLISEMPLNELVSVYALVKTGSATEGEYLGTGISHFLEHMLFKTNEHHAVGEIAAQIQAVGGTINASTGKDYTIYTITVPIEAFDTALTILSDMLKHTTMDAAETEKEREVIFGEMRLHNDNPDRKLGELTSLNVYSNHPYRHPIIGYPELFAKVTKEDLEKYYRRFYAPNNVVLSIAGGVKETDIFPKIEEKFKNFQRQIDVPRNLPQEPLQLNPRVYEEAYQTDLTRFSLAFQGVSLLNRDLYALDVLAMILGQGESSRLYKDLFRQKQLVYGIESYNHTPIDQGIFGIEGTIDYNKLSAVLSEIQKEIDLIKEKGVTPSELEKSKKQVISDYVFSNQTTSSIAYSRANDQAFTGDYDFSEHYIDGVKEVSLQDVKRVAQQYLIKERSTLTILKPKTQASSLKEEAKEEQKFAIKKYTLNNGLRILLREDHTLPIVSVELVMHAGTREEPAELNGLSKLTAAVWTKGLKGMSAEDISELTESKGMSLGSFSGKNSMGMSIDFLSEDLSIALNLLDGFIKNPTFPEKEMLKIKPLMLAQLKIKKDDISAFTAQTLREELFLKHPYRLDESGNEEGIKKITRDNILQFFAKHAVASNMVLSVFGDIDSDKLLTVLKNKFESLPKQPIELPSFSEDPIETVRTKINYLDKEQSMVMIGFPAINFEHPDRYGLEVLTSILGSSFSGRLFTNVRENVGKAYTVGGQFVPGIDTGYTFFFALIKPGEAPKVQEIIEQQIKRIQNEYVSDKELSDIKIYLKGTFKEDIQTNSGLNFIASLDELYGLGYDRYQKYAQSIDSVTKEDIKRLANMYLNLNQCAVVTTQPPAK
jgi:zinc protease